MKRRLLLMFDQPYIRKLHLPYPVYVWILQMLAHPGFVNDYGVRINTYKRYAKKERSAGRRIIPFEDWRNEGPQGEIRV